MTDSNKKTTKWMKTQLVGLLGDINVSKHIKHAGTMKDSMTLNRDDISEADMRDIVRVVNFYKEECVNYEGETPASDKARMKLDAKIKSKDGNTVIDIVDESAITAAVVKLGASKWRY